MLNTFITKPFMNLLFVLHTALPGHDFGVAVVVLTLLIRFALYPLAKKQLHSQKALSAIQPEVNTLKEKYKDPKEFQAKVMELYKEKEVNPFGSCLPLLIQMPFIIGLFYVFVQFKESAFLTLTDNSGILGQIYPFVRDWGFVKEFIASNATLNTHFLGMADLAKPSIVLAVIAGILQFIQSKMLTPKNQGNDQSAKMMSQMTYIFPALTVFIALNLPAALPLYWTVTTLFAIGQQYLIMHRDVEVLEETSESKRSKKS